MPAPSAPSLTAILASLRANQHGSDLGRESTAIKYSQAHRIPPTSLDGLNSPPTLADAGRMLARNSKTEGRGFESFRPCHLTSPASGTGVRRLVPQLDGLFGGAGRQ